MYKGIRRFAAAALAVAMIAASPLASFAAENDATTGPAFDADLLARVGEEVPTADTSSSDSGQAQAGVAPDGSQTSSGQDSAGGQDGAQTGAGHMGTASRHGRDLQR